MTAEIGLLHGVHDSYMSAHPLVFPHDADTQANAAAGPDAKAPPISVNEDTVAHQVVDGGTGAHQGAERGQVGVEAYGDLQSQSHTAQQVCSILNLPVHAFSNLLW